MKRHPAVLAKVDDYLAVHGVLSFSIITRYEVLRGLKAKNATTQIATFERTARRRKSFRLPMRSS